MALISAVVQNTKHEDTINISYAYDRLRINEAEKFQSNSARGLDDIRFQWISYEKLNKWFDDAKPIILKYKCVEDRKV